MLSSPKFLAAAAVIGLAVLVPAQQKGALAPSFEIQKTWNDAPAAFEEFAGKVVILDFAQTW